MPPFFSTLPIPRVIKTLSHWSRVRTLPVVVLCFLLFSLILPLLSLSLLLLYVHDHSREIKTVAYDFEIVSRLFDRSFYATPRPRSFNESLVDED